MRDGQVFWVSSSRPEESRAQRLIRYNFWLSALLLVAMVLWSYVLLGRTGEQVSPIGLGGRWAWERASNPGGVIYVIMEVVAGWLFYRKGGTEARGAAAFVGLYLIAALLVLVGSVAPGESPDPWVSAVVLYAIASHLLYAIAGSSERL